LALRVAEQHEQFAVRFALRLVGAQVERLLKPALGLVGCELRERTPPRPLGVLRGLVKLDGRDRLAPVVGELADALPGRVADAALECLGDATVKPRPPGGAELLVQAVLDQCMAEREPAWSSGTLDDE
jgi:hypothetical protein